jgi:hypothetical protein
MLEINEVGDSTYLEWGDPDRFFGGIALFKAGKAQKLVFTGGKMPFKSKMKFLYNANFISLEGI